MKYMSVFRRNFLRHFVIVIIITTLEIWKTWVNNWYYFYVMNEADLYLLSFDSPRGPIYCAKN